MTSTNGNIFRVTGHLCGEITGPWWIPRTKTSFDVFFDLRLNKRLSKQSSGWWFETLSSPLWRHYNVTWLCYYSDRNSLKPHKWFDDHPQSPVSMKATFWFHISQIDISAGEWQRFNWWQPSRLLQHFETCMNTLSHGVTLSTQFVSRERTFTSWQMPVSWFVLCGWPPNSAK